MSSCLLSFTPTPFGKGIFSKRNESVPDRANSYLSKYTPIYKKTIYDTAVLHKVRVSVTHNYLSVATSPAGMNFPELENL